VRGVGELTIGPLGTPAAPPRRLGRARLARVRLGTVRLGRVRLGLAGLLVMVGTIMSTTPTAAATTLTMISAGAHDTCARFSDGTVRCWGFNADGELGNGTKTNSSTPVTVSGIASATRVSVGGYHACARLAAGSIRCWGYNASGELGNGTKTSSSKPVAVSGISTAIAVSAGGYHTCALLSSGTVKCWGSNADGELGNGTRIDSSTPVTVSGITTATAISANQYDACALLSGGSIKCWGYNNEGELGNGTRTNSSKPVAVTGITNATAISAGGYETCALLTGGAVKCWGYNGDGELGNGSNTTSSTPVAVSGITTATAVSAGGYHVCARLSSGAVKCWGYNAYGELGNGTKTSASTPVTVKALTGATAVSSGAYHTCAVLSGGSASCWGYNSDGELGDGTKTTRLTPTAVRLATPTAAPTPTSPTAAPAVSSFSASTKSPTNGTSITYSLRFSKAVTGLAAKDLAITGTSTAWKVAQVQGSGSSYTIKLTAAKPPSGTVILALAPKTVVDSGGRTGPAKAATAPTVTVDRTPPTVMLILRKGPEGSPAASATLTNPTSLTYEATFSENVSALGSSAFVLGGTSTDCVVGTPAGSGKNYTVSLTNCSAGIMVLTIQPNTVTDAAGNRGPATAVSAKPVTIKRDGEPPSFGSVGAPKDNPVLSIAILAVIAGLALAVMILFSRLVRPRRGPPPPRSDYRPGGRYWDQ
jgi:alpha-tubulin suppressor-like RCC1 family protein